MQQQDNLDNSLLLRQYEEGEDQMHDDEELRIHSSMKYFQYLTKSGGSVCGSYFRTRVASRLASLFLLEVQSEKYRMEHFVLTNYFLLD